ncbi:MAG: hypothetical protein MJ181_11810 [Treponema sp.]|nr:hypothetical protein [Treponema sp.]
MAEAKTLEQIEKEIAETKAALANVQGSETEVYARIVGYYRSVRNWNKGKRDEFEMRKNFTLEDSKVEERANEIAKTDSSCACSAPVNTTATANSNVASYELFVRKTCPNCPPVKAYMADVTVLGRSIDVDSEEGLAEAARKGVFAAPTVICYDAAGNETARCHNVEELQAVFEKALVTA